MTTELDQIMDSDLVHFDEIENLTPTPINPTLARTVDAVDELSEDTVRRMIVAVFQPLTDAQLCHAYQSTDGESGNPIADLLAVAAEERGLDL